MERNPRKIQDKDANDRNKWVFDNAMGNPLILNSAPGKDDLKANTWGLHGTDIYVKTANNKLVKLSGTEIT